MKKSLVITLLVIMLISLFAGCGSNGEISTPPTDTNPAASPNSSTTDLTDGSVVVGKDLEITDETKYYEELTIIQDNTKTAILDPHNTASATSSTTTVFMIIYDTLISYEGEEYVPELATSWETEDYQTFTFHLRDDVYFHNGEKFTADDVAFTIDRAKELGVGSKAGAIWGYVDTYEIEDDCKIVLNLVTANVDFCKEISYSACGIINREACEANAEEGTWIGTGAYKVSDFVSNEYGVYLANEEYWDEPPITKKLTIKFVAEETSRLIALQNNEADVVFGINPVEFPNIEADPDYACFSYVVHNAVYVAFNLDDPIMDDINFRKAVAAAMNRDDLMLAARNGYAEPPQSGSFWGYGTEYKNLDLPLIPYDIEAAKEYLAQSDYDGQTIEICCAIPDITICAQVLQQQLAKIGINAELHQTDTTGLNAYTAWGNNQAQMVVYTGGWTSLASSSRPWYYPGNNYNRANYDNPEVNALLDEAPTILDEEARKEAYLEMQAIATEDIPFLTCYYNKHLVCCQNGVGGMILNNDSCQDYSHIYRIIED